MPRKSRTIVAAGLASAAIVISLAPATAQAAPSAQPASSSACASDAEIIYNVNITLSNGTVVGNLQLKYSPSCRATWARVTSKYAPGDVYAYDQSSAGFGQSCSGTASAPMGCNTGLVNDAGLTSYAYGQVYDGSTPASAYTPSF